jgi:secondary thiamine-phosphate synthase enzyme
MFRSELKILPQKEFTDITDIINKKIKNSGYKDGIILINSLHTTLGLKILENEILSLSDIDDFLKRVVPSTIDYAHDKINLRQVSPNERVNGISHVRMLFFDTSITLPIQDGKLLLGEWQKLFLVEMDGSPCRDRTIILTIL